MHRAGPVYDAVSERLDLRYSVLEAEPAALPLAGGTVNGDMARNRVRAFWVGASEMKFCSAELHSDWSALRQQAQETCAGGATLGANLHDMVYLSVHQRAG